jgi:hypothetical protein
MNLKQTKVDCEYMKYMKLCCDLRDAYGGEPAAAQGARSSTPTTGTAYPPREHRSSAFAVLFVDTRRLTLHSYGFWTIDRFNSQLS